PGGATAFSCEGDTNVTVEDVFVPNFTVAPGTNPLPVIVTVLPPTCGPLFGLRLEIADGPYAYRSPFTAALVPAGVCTVTRTVPGDPGGATAVSCEVDRNVTVEDVFVPNFTVAPGTNRLPVIVTVFPPVRGPPFGVRREITGAPYAYRSSFTAALVPV